MSGGEKTSRFMKGRDAGFSHDTGKNSTSAHNGHKLKSVHKVAEMNHVGKTGIHRYIRLTYLIPELLEVADNGMMPLLVGVNFSYLDAASQQAVCKYFYIDRVENATVGKSALIKRFFLESGKSVTECDIKRVLTRKPRKHNNISPKESMFFTVSRNKFEVFANKLPDDRVLAEEFLEYLREQKKYMSFTAEAKHE
jgi:hypothetical protein